MLKTRLLHPGILAALGEAGHGAQVLIADGNYPLLTRSNAAAHRVYLNLAPGLVTVTDVLEVLREAIPIEAAHVMIPETGAEPGIFAEFRELLPATPLQPLSRIPFYDAARGPDLALAIATGEQRIYANLLLTIGVVTAAELPHGQAIRSSATTGGSA
ncbi:MAG: L-fucose mutarotase [Chloroflexota bacterium]|jgi:L-fucose mutarotase|nr:L-fucose mutarotase [Chloroflexota bacterium]